MDLDRQDLSKQTRFVWTLESLERARMFRGDTVRIPRPIGGSIDAAPSRYETVERGLFRLITSDTRRGANRNATLA